MHAAAIQFTYLLTFIFIYLLTHFCFYLLTYSLLLLFTYLLTFSLAATSAWRVDFVGVCKEARSETPEVLISA